MDPRRAGSVMLVFLALLVLAWAGLYFGGKNDDGAVLVVREPAAASVILTHSIDGATHRYEGAVEAPTPCHELSAAVEVTYSSPPKGNIALTTEPQEGGVCAQVVTKQPFSISFMSEEIPEISLTVNGEPQMIAIVEGR